MDPKLKGSIERIVTIYLTYLITKYGSGIAGLNSIIPDIIVVGGSALSLAYGLYANRKVGLLADAATIPEVKKIELDPRNINTPALVDATPPKVVTGTQT